MMLRQLTYQSTAAGTVDQTVLRRITSDSLPFNTNNDISGILVFDGSHFFQVLEGPSDAVTTIFERIQSDPRHTDIIKITDTVVSERDFAPWRLRTLAIDETQQHGYWLPSDMQIQRHKPVFSVLGSFASGKWKVKNKPAVCTLPKTNSMPVYAAEPINSHIRFAYQPIIDTSHQVVTSVEALLRDTNGRYPADVLGQYNLDEQRHFDLESKAIAIKQASELLADDQSLSINLTPGAIIQRADAADFLLFCLKENGLRPDQLIVEVTENEIIGEHDKFLLVAERLRHAGIRLAIDDFGAGYAGLSLLTEFLPDKIKIDRCLATNIHASGPRQAIVYALIEFASTMGIPLIVEGIENVDEWRWLMQAGISRFQGFLFAKPLLNGIDAIAWQDLSQL